jgi:hypothetical protein
VTDKVLSTGLESEFGVDVLHRVLVEVETCSKGVDVAEA